jgi:hypothetical protein
VCGVCGVCGVWCVRVRVWCVVCGVCGVCARVCACLCVCVYVCACARTQHVTTQASSDDNEPNNDAPVSCKAENQCLILAASDESPERTGHCTTVRDCLRPETLRPETHPDLWHRSGRGLVGTGGELGSQFAKTLDPKRLPVACGAPEICLPHHESCNDQTPTPHHATS